MHLPERTCEFIFDILIKRFASSKVGAIRKQNIWPCLVIKGPQVVLNFLAQLHVWDVVQCVQHQVRHR